MTNKTWSKEFVVFQIYPSSFKDTSGNDIDKIKGITSKLTYLKNLDV